MQLLAQHNNEHAAQQPQTPRCHFTNSDFYPKLTEGGASGRDYNYAGVNDHQPLTATRYPLTANKQGVAPACGAKAGCSQ